MRGPLFLLFAVVLWYLIRAAVRHYRLQQDGNNHAIPPDHEPTNIHSHNAASTGHYQDAQDARYRDVD